MHNNHLRFVAELIADCHNQGITEYSEIIKHISGSYTVEESCTEKYADILAVTTSNKDE